METGKAGHARGLVIVLAAAFGLGAVVWAVNRGERPLLPPPPGSPSVAVPAPTAAASLPQTASEADVAGAPAETAVAPDAGAPQEPAAVPEATTAAEAPPTFDVVRVTPDGSALVAGTAAPGAEVTVYADAAPLASATADADGNFVAMFEAEPSAVPQALTLGAGDLRSDETVMLLPEAPAAPASSDSAPAGGVPTPAPAPDAAEAADAPAPEIAAAVVVGPEGVEVLPAPGSGGRVALGSISYADAGAVTLAGVGTAGSTLRAYVDDRLAEEAAVGDDGRWSLALDDVAAGLYRLRIDQIGPDGRVGSRVETPFQRDFPRPRLPRPGGPTAPAAVPPGGTITVQPGGNLWTIAREHYGSGVLYTQIFTANRELIRDPELIYPGQIFAMPEVEGRRAEPDVTGPRPRTE